MGHANGRIWSPVSWYDAGHTIGIISQDEGTICRSSQINPLSKWKPVADSQTRMGIMTLARMKSTDIGFGFFSYQGSGRYGSIYEQGITNLLNRALTTKEDTTKNGAWWGHFYSRPRGLVTYNEPYRCLDFANFGTNEGYNHNAVSPFIASDVASSSLQSVICQLTRQSNAEIYPEDFDTVSQSGGKTAWRYGIIYRKANSTGDAMLALGPTLAQQEASEQPRYVDISINFTEGGTGVYDCLWVVTKGTSFDPDQGSLMLCDGLFKVHAGTIVLQQLYTIGLLTGTPAYRISGGNHYLRLSSCVFSCQFSSITAGAYGAQYDYVLTVFGKRPNENIWTAIWDKHISLGHAIPQAPHTFQAMMPDDDMDMGEHLSEFTSFKLRVQAETTSRSSDTNAVTLITDNIYDVNLTQVQ